MLKVGGALWESERGSNSQWTRRASDKEDTCILIKVQAGAAGTCEN
jgi:hypothetical protein